MIHNPFENYNEELQNQYKIPRLRVVVCNLTLTSVIMTLATFLSFFFRYIGFNESNFIMAYILGVLIVANQTEGYFFGILASVLGVLAFNFFFTEPYYTFSTYRADYPVTFVIMLIVAVFTSTLTAKAKQEARLSSLREKRTQILYQTVKSLLEARSISQITEVGGCEITKLFGCSAIIAMGNLLDNPDESNIFPFMNEGCSDNYELIFEKQAIIETFKFGVPVGNGTKIFAESPAFYLPIKGQSGILGVLGISFFNNRSLSEEQKLLLEGMTTQIALAMEREKLWEKQQKSKMEVERERMRGNLLRAISHDLRTPLTGILGASATILELEESLEQKVKRELLQGIYEDAGWLIHSVENILSITRIDEGKVDINKNMEAVEEIIAAAVARVKKLAEKHTLKINIPDDLIMLPMDGTLIEQVLVNLLDNAVKYTPSGSIIEIKIYLDEENVVFEVRDNGKGIPEENLPFIFDRFYTAPNISRERRGTGLGLAICKSIVTAHGGQISAFNNPSGGATFRFLLPLKE